MARAPKLTIFDEILARAFRQGLAAKDAQKSMKWFSNLAQELGSKVTPQQLMKEDARLTKSLQYGRMYHFWYDAKWKSVLPYWDRFPLIFPIAPRKGGFLGINLHYLPPLYRAKLMSALYTVSNNKKFDKTTKLIISYQILDASAKMKWFKPCVKHYLRGHVQSPFLRIEASEWSIAMMLPTQRFQKKSAQHVWKKSLEQV